MNAEVPALQVGDWLDVIDGDGIWNVAQVLKLPTTETVEVTYDCWGDEYNEKLRRDSDRIAPFHTHTWAVKCWAKLATWPWWPALLTVRSPGSNMGSQNLRLEERLLVDFLDNSEFPERCRCWVKRSNIVAFQSDEATRKRLIKTKKKGIKPDGRSKMLTFAMTLLTKCDAQENFPEFVEGTLPMQFEHNVTKSTEEVRKEMGEEIWMCGFVDNRINHAATHAYTPVIAASGESDNGNSVKLSKPGEETYTSTTRACDTSPKQEEHNSLLDSGNVNKVGTPTKATDVPTGLVVTKMTTQRPKKPKKRVRPSEDDETLDSTDYSRAGKATLPYKQGPNSFDSECQEGNRDEKVSKLSTDTKKLRIEPRRYGKTPKKLKTAKRSASNLPLYIPPYARLLPRAELRDEEHTTSFSHARHATKPRSRVKKGVSDKVLLASDQNVQLPNAAMRRASSCAGDETVNPLNSLARLTKATLRADEKLRNMEAVLEGKLTELAEKSAKAEELRNKCAALPTRMRSSISFSASTSQKKYRSNRQVCSLTPGAASETQGAIQENLPLGSSSYGSSNASGVPTVARRSSQPECDIRGLELMLDDIVSKWQGQNLSAATTPAELDALKAELLHSPEVQAAITRLEHPSYGWAAPAGISYRRSSPPSDNDCRCALEEAKPRYSKYSSVAGHSVRRPSQRSLSQQLSRSWGYDREPEAGSERLQGLSTYILPDPPPADHSTFCFSVNDNFSIDQWYRDLYPKSFVYQRSW